MISQKGQVFEPFNNRSGGLARSANLTIGGDFAIGSRGQAFEPFKLLIGAVMALAVLVIILGAVNYFEQLRLDISKQRFYEGLENAVDQPNGAVLELNELQFKRSDSFSARTIGEKIGIPAECVMFNAVQDNAFTITNSGGVISINENLIIDVFAKCSANSIVFPDTCEVGCEISFGELQFG